MLNTHFREHTHTVHINEADTVTPENYTVIRGYRAAASMEGEGREGAESPLSSDITTDPSELGPL